MIIERSHNLSPAAVRQSLDGAISGLLANLPRGVQVSDVQRVWDGDVLRFAFTAAKQIAFMSKSVSVEGTVAVTDHTVRLETELPALVKTLIGEDRIRGMLEREIDARITRV